MTYREIRCRWCGGIIPPEHWAVFAHVRCIPPLDPEIQQQAAELEARFRALSREISRQRVTLPYQRWRRS